MPELQDTSCQSTFLITTTTLKLNLNIANCKCDEAKPHCMKCVNYGVACNYTLPTGSDLQLATEHKLESSPGHVFFGAQTLKPSLQSFAIVGDGPDSFTLEVEGLARLSRFQNHTVHTFATMRSTELYKNEVVRMAMEVSHRVHYCRQINTNHTKCPKVSVLDARHSSYHCNT
jgi:hypothetical protein